MKRGIRHANLIRIYFDKVVNICTGSYGSKERKDRNKLFQFQSENRGRNQPVGKGGNMNYRQRQSDEQRYGSINEYYGLEKSQVVQLCSYFKPIKNPSHAIHCAKYWGFKDTVFIFKKFIIKSWVTL